MCDRYELGVPRGRLWTSAAGCTPAQLAGPLGHGQRKQDLEEDLRRADPQFRPGPVRPAPALT